MAIPAPSGTVKAWEYWQREQANLKVNTGLMFSRYIPDLTDASAQAKRDALKSIEALLTSRNIDVQLLEQWKARWHEGVREFSGASRQMATDWRLIAGLGGKGALEVGFTFHRYGLPYLPASSVKGVARARAVLEIAERAGTPKDSIPNLTRLDPARLNKDEGITDLGLSEPDDDMFRKNWAEPLGDAMPIAEAFRAIFGTQSNAGQAIFFDGVPNELPVLELDIMNPHYPKYYREPATEPPTESQSPNPVFFLTVAPKTPFLFGIGWRSAPDEEMKSLAWEWLIGGLTDLGIGSKTSSGYGFFAKPVVGGAEEVATVAIDSHAALASTIIANVNALRDQDVAGQLNESYKQWKAFEGSESLKLDIARAISAKGQNRVSKKARQEGGWFDEIIKYIKSS